MVDRAIAAHNGRIVKTTGDGILVEFASAVDAVNCAMSVQNMMTERNANAQPASSISMRFLAGVDGADGVWRGPAATSVGVAHA